MSEYRLGVSEIGVSFPDETFGHDPQSPIPVPGIPFIVMLRDILKYDISVSESITRMAKASRDADLILGVGDGKAGYFRGFEYGPWVFDVFTPTDMRPQNSTWHPQIEDVVYWGMDWMCPSYNYVLATLLQKYWGNITVENAIRYISAEEQSGDNHIAFYDLIQMDLYVAFASPNNQTGGPIEAYYRQYTHFNASSLFSVPPEPRQRGELQLKILQLW